MTTLSRHHALLLAALLSVAAVARAQDPGQPSGPDPALANMISDNGQPDPPQRVARIALLQGTASFEPAGIDQFNPAELNYPMTTGDRLYSAQGALAELQTGQIALRLGQTTDVTIVALTDQLARFGLAGGSVHLREFAIDPNTSVELDTPNVAITVTQPGDIRVDVDPDRDLTYLTVVSGSVQVEGNNLLQNFGPGTSLMLNGLNPLEVSSAMAAQPDGLDDFSESRDREYLAAEQDQGQYLNAGTIGASDLADAGSWETDDQYGPVWYPTVDVSWQPYACGRWAYVGPWGWTWIGCEPWGFAPFHYGRWVHRGPRWGWLPGPPILHPVYAPALVTFVTAPGGGRAWFPLGPHEVYTPPYHVTPLYMNRVNVTNIYTRDRVNLRNVYNDHALEPQFAPDPHRDFAYRTEAVAVPANAFAAGRPVTQNRLPVDRGQLAQAPILARPGIAPLRTPAGAVPASALPPRNQHPVTASSGPPRSIDRPVEQASPTPAPNPGGSPGGPPRSVGAPVQRVAPNPPAAANPAPAGNGNPPRFFPRPVAPAASQPAPAQGNSTPPRAYEPPTRPSTPHAEPQPEQRPEARQPQPEYHPPSQPQERPQPHPQSAPQNHPAPPPPRDDNAQKH